MNWVLDTPRAITPVAEGVASSEAADKGRETSNTFRPTRSQHLEAISAAELDSGDYRVEFIVRNLLVEGQPHLLCGAKKCLKTNVGLDLAISIATGTPFLGSERFAVPNWRRVAFMSGESGLATIQETSRRICDAKGLSLSSIGDRLIVSSRIPKLSQYGSLDELEAYLVDNGVRVLLVDPAYLCIDADGGETSMFRMGSILVEFARVCQAAGVTPILVHHTKKTRSNAKAEFYDPPELEDIAYAGFQEFARAWMMLGRRAKYDPDSGNHELWFGYGGSVGHSGLIGLDIDEGHFPNRRWSVTIADASEVRASAERDRERRKVQGINERADANKRRILDLLKNGPETKTVIRDNAGMSTQACNQAFSELSKEGSIEATTVEKGNRKYEGWILSPSK